MIKQINCKHYKRNCDKKAPCCQIYYPCRLCHDQNYKGPKSDGCKVETMDRYNVKEIRCRTCLTEQPPSNLCNNCGIQFARYYCEICKLYEDDKKKNIFHCEQCKMCRLGKREEFFHCEKCDVCLSISIKPQHNCIEKAFEQNCAVCMDYLKNSTQLIQQFTNCPHFIHVKCLEKMLKKGLYNCPNCNVAIYKMTQQEIQDLDQINEHMKNELSEEQLKQVVDIICSDCQAKSSVQFNIYLKCSNCGSYNTKK
ncbi:unnamed protein product [Paramecium pentaurelia]|uniref:Uncharacterized protein n=1 Tax=Paramecium pentaurelia TaxID=43138 RepID=A0A8S1VKN1_9CILI|nr:unnamed protein product [Paramecium pentaurelia]